jgi:hypothetical protein
MVTTQFDLDSVHKAYAELKNYRILTNEKVRDKTAIIFFSSNGLYYPNTDETAQKALFEKNRFEWTRIAPRNVRKLIFVRDVYKTWYFKGLNRKINSIEDMVVFLKSELQGYSVQLAGVSSGGYAAVLFGGLLDASRAFSFAGQFSLTHWLETLEGIELNPYLYEKRLQHEYHQYYDLRAFLNNIQMPVFYFYPNKSQMDTFQRSLVNEVKTVYAVGVQSAEHNAPLLAPCLRDIFSLSSVKLQRLSIASRADGYSQAAINFRVGRKLSLVGHLLRHRRDLLKPYFKDILSDWWS